MGEFFFVRLCIRLEKEEGSEKRKRENEKGEGRRKREKKEGE